MGSNKKFSTLAIAHHDPLSHRTLIFTLVNCGIYPKFTFPFSALALYVSGLGLSLGLDSSGLVNMRVRVKAVLTGKWSEDN